MNEIKAGDLVYVARWPHEHGSALGLIFFVQGINDCCACKTCGQLFAEKSAYRTPLHAVPLSWLRKIPPLHELDEVERREETPA